MNRKKLRRLGAGLLGACALILTTSFATPVLAGGEGVVGKVTKRPIPRYVSMKASEGNVRRGPSLTHRIDWVYKRRDMPLRITAEHGHWRRVEDRDGIGGWVHYSLLSGTRTVLVEKDMLTLHARPDPAAPVMAALELGVVARVSECGGEWCLLRSGGFKGWAPKARLWGVRSQEVFD
ncbi:SH3 domain-containing protein [Sulfitobacter donghicola]|uniref:SH3 domain-containing protein n=1 Tax=Sulfitobacter donghicola TaxID=421000 RepID=UPI00046A6D2A|nr:SH3 domain-containing protein [Sulfitobacter donghicola]KIN67472.1 Aspartyl-trna synthetase [Sulfitobacter donghicola DSW-25 = KCTC 12864 = JCM 14565]